MLEHWIARRRSLNWINLAFFRLNALVSAVFLIVTAAEVIFQGGFKLAVNSHKAAKKSILKIFVGVTFLA